MKMWTRYFGGPKKLKLDLGPELDNQFVEQMRDTLGREIVAVPEGADWSHWTTKNKHGGLREMAQNMIDDIPGAGPGRSNGCVCSGQKLHCKCVWVPPDPASIWLCTYDSIFSSGGG